MIIITRINKEYLNKFIQSWRKMQDPPLPFDISAFELPNSCEVVPMLWSYDTSRFFINYKLGMASVDNIKMVERLKSTLFTLIRTGRAIIDKTAVYRRQRWSYLIFLDAYVLYRIFRYEYLGLMYFVGLYIIYLIVQYLTPSGLPDPDQDQFENSQFLEQSRSILTSSEGDRPVLRSLTEFGLWKNLVLITLASLVCTWFQFFLVPVYWPFLLIYFLWLIGLAVAKHYQHMKKYGYSFADFNSKKPIMI